MKRHLTWFATLFVGALIPMALPAQVKPASLITEENKKEGTTD